MMKERPTNPIQAVWVISVCTVALVIMLMQLIRQENAFPIRRISGEIESSIVGREWYSIRLCTSNRTYWHRHRSDENEISILREKAVVGENVTIWVSRQVGRHNAGHRFRIRKMIINDEMIIPYRRPIGGQIFLMLFVSFFIALGVWEIIDDNKKKRKDETKK